MVRFAIWIAALEFALMAGGSAARADNGVDPRVGALHVSAALSAGGPRVASGLHWRVFAARADADGTHPLVVESADASPIFTLPPGDYLVHVAFGLASATRTVSLGAEARDEEFTMAAGALRISATLESAHIDASRVSLNIYVPERNNSEAKLVYSKARLGEVIGVPEGAYHIVSTYLDTVGVGSFGVGKPGGGAPNAPVPTNSIVAGDIRVAAGKIVDVTLRHRCAAVTLKLVNAPNGEALANTTFTVLTPGGDIIRELIGAFPSLVLAEGEYVVVARHDSKTYQSNFPVKSGLDRDVEVIAKEDPKQGQ